MIQVAPSMISGMDSALMAGIPYQQHYAAPITNTQGQQIGQVEVHEETIPMTVIKEEKPSQQSLQEAKVQLAQSMVCMTGFLNHLQTQAHLIHFNFCGPNFLSIHEFLKEHYGLHNEQFDRVGEMLRSLDFYMPMCANGLNQAATDFKHCGSYEPTEMLMTYLQNLEAAGMKAKCMGKWAEEACAPDVENLAADLVEAMFKSVYLLKSVLRPGIG